eukprot:2230111-Alexandrium_andersonii.AAC.1
MASRRALPFAPHFFEALVPREDIGQDVAALVDGVAPWNVRSAKLVAQVRDFDAGREPHQPASDRWLV